MEVSMEKANKAKSLPVSQTSTKKNESESASKNPSWDRASVRIGVETKCSNYSWLNGMTGMVEEVNGEIAKVFVNDLNRIEEIPIRFLDNQLYP